MTHKPYGQYERFAKRPQDFLCALAAIIVLSPVMAATAVLVRVKLGSPVLFKQDRPGKDGKIFKEIHRGSDTRKEFFDKIIDVVTLLGGDLSDAL